MKKYYHATDYNNLTSIVSNGLNESYDGVVYITEKPLDALKFIALRMVPKILVVEIKVLKKDQSKVVETLDHDERFFSCKAYGYIGSIPANMITGYTVYDNPLLKR